MNKYLITHRQGQILTALWNGSRVIRFQAEDMSSAPEGAGPVSAPELRVGDIRVGRVSSYVKNIHAAFVEVLPGVNCFWQLDPGEKIRVGEELPVLITREAVKTKMAVCTPHLSLAGRYLVLVTDRQDLAFSGKLSAARKAQLREMMGDVPRRWGVGFILRTNAGDCEDPVLLQEAEELAASLKQLREIAAHRPPYSLLRAGSPAYLSMLRDTPSGSVEEIVTDIPSIAREVCAYMEGLPPGDRVPVRLYEDETYSLAKLYRLEHFLEEALSRRVWLPSGGYLVIDPTEALTVIDVNTGRYSGHKKKEEAFLKIDLEACDAILTQMQLRNLSGIIIVDFIDLPDPAMAGKLEAYLRDCLAKDCVRSVLVDITPLHLAEITRKKVRGTLAEQLHLNGSLQQQYVIAERRHYGLHE